MDNDFCLHPDLIDVVVEDLLSSDIISKAQVAELKNDTYKIVDPNLIMDIRHKEVKKESLINIDRDMGGKHAQKRNVEKISLDMFSKAKDLKTIDKEIANTKRNLEMFQNQLVKRNESFSNTISSLEKENTSSPVVVNLNMDETRHYFNLHLDSLESEIVKDLGRDKVKTWKPFELKPPPVINVITTLKVVDIKHSMIHFGEEKLKLSEVCEIQPIQVSGKTLQGTLPEVNRSIEVLRDFVPNNTPSLDTVDTPILELLEASRAEEDRIARYVLNTWKLYIKTKRALKLGEENRKKAAVNLLKLHFISWMVYTKSCKNKTEASEANCASDCTVNKVIVPLKNANCIEINRVKEKKNLEFQEQVGGPCVLTRSILKFEKFPTSRDLQLNVKGKNEVSADCHKTIVKKAVIPKINVIHEVVKMVPTKHLKTEPGIKKSDVEIKATDIVLPKQIQQQLRNRFAAQEKIIQQQSAVIEKQKQMILDLKAQFFKETSKLNLKISESELNKSPAVFNKTARPVLRPAVSEDIPGVQNTNVDHSEVLTKRLLERQNYCKQLAEMTKMRKARIEEEKAKQKLEEEEKLKKEKEDNKLQRNIKIKIEQKRMEEIARIALVEKQVISDLTKKATDHYKLALLKKTFSTLKNASSLANKKVAECKQLYERKLVKRIFVLWRIEINRVIAFKNQFADKYYQAKLMGRCWDTWRSLHKEFRIKMQVSEDMFGLKLQERMFRRWLAFTAEQYLLTTCKMELAERLHRRQLLRRSFNCWKNLPKLMFAEREKEQRRRAWRQAVQELIPDFSPVFAEQLEV